MFQATFQTASVETGDVLATVSASGTVYVIIRRNKNKSDFFADYKNYHSLGSEVENQ